METQDDRIEHLARVGYATRFGAGNDPILAQQKASKPWSIRNAMRYMSAQTIDLDDKDAINKLLPMNATVAQRIAVAAIQKACDGDMRAIRYLTDQIDGKLPQTNINAEFAALMEMSDDELNEIIANGIE